ncbi:MAG: RES family NAD+ phosphorylase [Actinobacteria bacterium]|nr:RES family NAD+ phosphorylase [Actinomycetota bacterium]
MMPLLVTRGGIYVRVADPGWDDPLTGAFAKARGSRWNAPRAFPLVYLNGDVRTARANVLQRFAGLPYGPEDLEPSAAPALVSTAVPEDGFVDVVSRAGCSAVGLPPTYPVDEDGAPVPHEACQPVGQAAWDSGLPGIACRSAAPAAPRGGEEMAWFGRREPLTPLEARSFLDWF